MPHPPEISVRRATTHDVPAITAIYNDAIAKTLASFWTEPRPESEIMGQLTGSSDRHPWFVAAAQGAVVGFAWSKPWNPRQGYDITCEVSIYIAESARGMGVGKALYTTLLAALDRLGYCNVIGGVALPNDASVRLHRSFGFREVARFEQVGIEFGRALDVAYYQLRLREAPGGEPGAAAQLPD